MSRVLTPTAARDLWCPFARMPMPARISGDWELIGANRSEEGNAASGCTCLATACMAWQPIAYDEKARGYCSAFGDGQDVL